MSEIDLSNLAEKIRQLVRELPVSDINGVVRGNEAYVDAKPHPEIGGGTLEITLRLRR